MILVDAGPLVAIVDASDQHHETCAEALRGIREPLGTVWPAITEAMYLLLDQQRGQQAVWEMLERRAVRLLDLDEMDMPRIRELMSKYANRPMDLADAALVRVAERDGLSRIFTVDRSDFEVYRIGGRKRFKIIPEAPPPGVKGRARSRSRAGRRAGGPRTAQSGSSRRPAGKK